MSNPFPPGYSGLPTGEQLNSLAVVKMESFELSNARLKTLHSKPLTILPAPGPGVAYIVLASMYQLVWGNVAFVSTDSGPGLYYGHADDTATWADGGSGNSPFSATESQILQPLTNMADTTHQQVLTSNMVNQPIILANVSSDMTAGDSTGRITILYYLIQIS